MLRGRREGQFKQGFDERGITLKGVRSTNEKWRKK